MTRTLSIAALILIVATSFTFAESRDKKPRHDFASNTPTATLNVSCIQNAVEKRDSAIIIAHDTFNTSIINALTIRKDALKLAWAKEARQDRTSARKATYDVFKISQKNAHRALRAVRKTSWDTFNTEMKACGVSKEAHNERASEVNDPTSSL